MIDLSATYRHYQRRLTDAMAARKLTNEEMAARLGAHSVTVSKLRTGVLNLDDEWRERIARAMQIDVDTLFGDAPLPSPQPWEVFHNAKKRGRKPPKTNDLTVYGWASGSAIGHRNSVNQLLDSVPRPPGLDGVETAYALRTRNESMVPRYLPGEILYVNPEENPRPSDHVIIQIQSHDNGDVETIVKRLDGITDDEVLVTQYNPAAQMRLKRKYVRHIHRVLAPNDLYPPRR